ncbi:MAG: cytochrome c biogenesis heme-transporting ATPase CcmA [Aquabacterium sp.]
MKAQQDMTLKASDLAFERGQRRLFSGIGFDVAPGEVLRVKGRNGSGKTSLLRVVCGLAQPVQGMVSWRGQPIRTQRERLHADLVFIGHGHALKDDLTACENVHIAAALSDQPCTRADARQALRRMGLADRADLPVRALSQGQRRRVLLARLGLATSEVLARRLLVLDEPFTALDQESVSALAVLLNAQLAAGATLVYTTHQPDGILAARLHEVVLGEAVPAANEAEFHDKAI